MPNWLDRIKAKFRPTPAAEARKILDDFDKDTAKLLDSLKIPGASVAPPFGQGVGPLAQLQQAQRYPPAKSFPCIPTAHYNALMGMGQAASLQNIKAALSPGQIIPVYTNGSLMYTPYSLADPRVESPFEVNMMECLVGWKAWTLENGVLRSASKGTEWTPDEPLRARCPGRNRPKMFDPTAISTYPSCVTTPGEHCTCGIYASDERSGAEVYLDPKDFPVIFFYPTTGTTSRDPTIPKNFLGELNGWGRYVRGDSGWRAEYAYPKCFYLERSQQALVAPLKKYHVPIYVEQPVEAYNPGEDGYDIE